MEDRRYADWPTIEATGISVPEDVTSPKSGGTIDKLVFSIDEDSRRAGDDVMQMTRDLMRQYPNPSAVRELARFARVFDTIVPRMPEFAEFIDRLVAEGDWSAVTRILGEGNRGRRFSSPFYLVALVERVCDHFGWSVRRAAVWLAEKYQAELHKGARAIENDYSRFKEVYHRHVGCRFIPPGRLLVGRPSLRNVRCHAAG